MSLFTKQEIIDMFNEAVDIIQRKKKYKTFHSENVLYELIFVIEEKEKFKLAALPQ